MDERYITITGMNHYYGMKPFEVGKVLQCQKEPQNPHDEEAIKVHMKEIGTIGYIANSPYTKATGTMGAGRLYEKVEDEFKVQVMFITSTKIICKVLEENNVVDKIEKLEVSNMETIVEAIVTSVVEGMNK